uniref:Ketopantoate reductase n=1 Tax=uncultured nuHF2 cluster bacterium HF0770_42C12 TaxID=723593 RepID=E7C7Y0_9BACT|nr:ketopantoate reductase [uncultured nuHF2 cluster bacterium HF0770_42C12]
MEKKIAVLGAGSIGSSVGADLTDAGLDVTIIDQWPAHVEVMKESGLDITMPDMHLQIPVTAWHLCELAEHMPQFDVVFLVVKSYDTKWLAQLIEPYLKEDGVFVGLQNGMNNETISSVVGVERTIGAAVELSAEIYTPGIVKRDTTRPGTWFGLGELDGSLTQRLEEVKEIMENVATITLTQNIEGAKWTKLICNTMTMGPIGLTGLKNWDARKLPGMFDMSVALGRESMAVGKALGYELEPVFGLGAEEFSEASDEVLIKAMETLMAHVGKEGVTAAIHDHIKGRQSEMSLINGLVARAGKKFGIPVTCNAAVTEIDRRINDGEIAMDPSNFGLLKSMIESIPNRL